MILGLLVWGLCLAVLGLIRSSGEVAPLLAAKIGLYLGPQPTSIIGSRSAFLPWHFPGMHTGNGLVKPSNVYVQFLTCMGNGFTKVLSHGLTRQVDGPEFD